MLRLFPLIFYLKDYSLTIFFLIINIPLVSATFSNLLFLRINFPGKILNSVLNLLKVQDFINKNMDFIELKCGLLSLTSQL